MLVLMMEIAQLEAAHKYYALNHAPRRAMVVSLENVRKVIGNHWRSVLKMPAGGAHAGGSMQTGFDMELISAAAVRTLFSAWPNYEKIKMGHSWEARTMEECALVCAFQDSPTGWGMWNGRPAQPLAGSKVHEAVLMFGPPMTITWKMRPDTTTVLSARAPLIIYTENDATILPPDDSQGKAFYLDPPGQQGYCRDLFREHARQLTKELLHSGFPLSAKLGRLADSSASE